MSTAILPWLEFAFCAALIGFAGPRLAKHGDTIARLTGLSRSWTGLVLLAAATSLPELFTGVSAVSVADAPNIAVGDALGSCTFNLVMLVLLDELSRREPMYRQIDRGHLLTAGFGIIMIGSAGVFVVLGQAPIAFGFLHIGGYTPLFVLLYLVAVRAAFVYDRRSRPLAKLLDGPAEPTLGSAIARYCGAAVVIAAAGSWLPFIGQDIATAMGWRTSFVGTMMIAGATSIPELVVTVSALRLGAVDMAIGSLLGSNLFDILILAIDDIAYPKGPLLAAVSPAHAVTAFAGVIMSGIFIVALLYQPGTTLRRAVNWTSLALLVVYMFSSYTIYVFGH